MSGPTVMHSEALGHGALAALAAARGYIRLTAIALLLRKPVDSSPAADDVCLATQRSCCPLLLLPGECSFICAGATTGEH